MKRTKNIVTSRIRVLALDLATTTGWALSEDIGTTQNISSGIWKLKINRFAGGGMRYVRLRKFLDEIGKVDLLSFEEVHRHMGTAAAHIYGGCLATITAWAEENNIPYEGIPVQTIKKFATGKGNASKEKMVQAFTDKTGQIPESDDEADAYWILMYTLEHIMPSKKAK